MEIMAQILLWATLLSSVIMAGVYFAFSTFVMRSLAALERGAGMRAMQSINEVILRSLFLPVFFGGTISSAAIASLGLIDNSLPAAAAMIAGGACYFIGMFLVTVIGNVPLNNRLAAADAGTVEGETTWRFYLKRWTTWNHLRTIACLAATVFRTIGLASYI